MNLKSLILVSSSFAILTSCSEQKTIEKPNVLVVQTEPNLEVEDLSEPVPEAEINNDTLSLEDIVESLSVRSERFTVDPNKDTVITCKKGTKVFLPANVLQFKDGSQPKGEVSVRIKECYEFSDFIGEDLSTTSGHDILETGGMLKIRCESDGKTLEIKSGSSYDIHFPKDENKPGMELFYGKRPKPDEMDWEPAAKRNQTENLPYVNGTISLSANNGAQVQTFIYSDGSSNRQLRINNYTSAIGNRRVDWKFKDTAATFFDYFRNTFKPTKKMLDDFRTQNFNPDYDLQLTSQGKVRTVKIEQASKAEYDSLLTRFLRSLPPFDMNTMGMYSENITYDIGFSSQLVIDGGYHEDGKSLREIEAKYADSKDETIEEIEKDDLNYYVMSASRFGWINCDRFYNTSEPKIDFAVNLPQTEDTKVLLVFKNISSMMPGQFINNGIVFKNIPINEPVKVVGISYRNGQPQLGILETITKSDGATLDEFEPFTLSELKKTLNTL